MNRIGEKEILSFTAVFFGFVFFVFGQWTSSMVTVTSLSYVKDWSELKMPEQVYNKKYISYEDAALIEKLTTTTGFGIFTGNKTVVDKFSLPIIKQWRKLSPNQQNKSRVKQNEQFFDEYLVSVSATCSYIVNAFSLVACIIMLVNLGVGGSRKVILQNIFATIAAGLVNFGLIVLVKCWPTSFLQSLHDDIQTGSNQHVGGYQNGLSFYLIIISFLCFCTGTCLSICARKKYSYYYSAKQFVEFV